MQLESRVDQRVRIGALGISVSFARGERIWTESSYKYEPSQLDAMGKAAGVVTTERWIDDEARFALTLLTARSV